MVDIIFPYNFLGAMGDPSKKKAAGGAASLCVGCGAEILDQYILRVSPDLEWHAACLKCAACRQALDETCTCFVREGKTYCKRDYLRLFGAKCGACSGSFRSSSDLVMRAKERVFHPECFRCSLCAARLLPGHRFALLGHRLLCGEHHRSHQRPEEGPSEGPGEAPGSPPLLPLQEACPGRPVSSSSSSSSSLRPHGPKGGAGSASEKTTRVRTVLNEKQLHTLRTCYAANPRPDALMKEQLVEMTGLSPRVIRVWFQNKRCKDKKKAVLLRQIQQQQQQEQQQHHNGDKASLQGLTGTPLVAGSPIRHDSAVQGNAVEVQTYQPPWKALSDFALQSDLDQPAFQQLLSHLMESTMAWISDHGLDSPPSVLDFNSQKPHPAWRTVSFSESGSLGNSSGSDVTSLSSQLPDTPNSMVPSPVET